jgi:SAM-dependent methyltransferase
VPRFVRIAAALLPGWLRPAARHFYRWARAALLRGNRVECPICQGRFRRFLPLGNPLRPGAQCPRCCALERDRLLWLYLTRETDFFSAGPRLLDYSPAPALAAELRRKASLRYVTTAISPEDHPDFTADAAALPVGDRAFDAALCIHVLEHVENDRAAMRELARVLRPGGLALVMSPADPARERTFEDARARTPEERRRLFGQADHVRIYGRDLPDRLAQAGLEVRAVQYAAGLSAQEVRRYGLRTDHLIYRCRRPA